MRFAHRYPAQSAYLISFPFEVSNVHGALSQKQAHCSNQCSFLERLRRQLSESGIAVGTGLQHQIRSYSSAYFASISNFAAKFQRGSAVHWGAAPSQKLHSS